MRISVLGFFAIAVDWVSYLSIILGVPKVNLPDYMGLPKGQSFKVQTIWAHGTLRITGITHNPKTYNPITL